MHVNDLLKIAVENGASDLHLKAGSYPMMRVRGMLVPATEEKRLDHDDMLAVTYAQVGGFRRPMARVTRKDGTVVEVAGGLHGGPVRR